MTNTEFQTIRFERGMSQEEFGKVLGLTGSHVSRIEAGKVRIVPKVLYKLNKYLSKSQKQFTPCS